MAKIDKDSFLNAITGMIGKQVVIKRRLNSRYVSAAPEIDPNRKPTPNQANHQHRFRIAAATAKRLANTPGTKELYEAAAKPGRSAYHRAFDDAFSPPVINTVISEGYTGKNGDKIFISATDDFKVDSVTVSIHDASDILIEQGAAILKEGIWCYTAAKAVNKITGCIITVKAYDLPRNETIKQITL